MEARWNDPRSDPGVAKAKREEHELIVDTAGLLMEAAEADVPRLAVIHLWYTLAAKPGGSAARSACGTQLSREPSGGSEKYLMSAPVRFTIAALCVIALFYLVVMLARSVAN
jgi:hypothetical protein